MKRLREIGNIIMRGEKLLADFHLEQLAEARHK